MKVIKTNAIASITATSEDGQHPASNLLNNSPKKAWIVANESVDEAVIDIEVTGTTDSIGIVGVTADDVTVHISDPNGIIWANVWWPEVDWVEVVDALDVAYEITEEDQGKFNIWVDFAQFTSTVVISIYFTKDIQQHPNMLISAGVIVVGVAETFPNPQFGISETVIDYSLTRELSNGAIYYKPRDRVRNFLGVLLLQRDNDFYRFLYDISRRFGLVPMMWHLGEDLGNRWVVYGRLTAMPEGEHSYPKNSYLNFNITEVL